MTADDLPSLITTFYDTAFLDPLIGPIFTDVAQLDLQAHLPIMCSFWESVLFGVRTYRGNAVELHRALHAKHPLTPEHFVRWLELWHATIDAHHEGPVAESAKAQAAHIAGRLQQRLA